MGTDRIKQNLTPVWRMMLPPPLPAIPLNDICLATSNQNALRRFDKFQEVCDLKDDQELWSTGRTNELDVNNRDTVGTFTINKMKTSGNYNEDDDDKYASSSNGTFENFFIISFLTVAIIASATLLYRRMNNQRYGTNVIESNIS